MPAAYASRPITVFHLAADRLHLVEVNRYSVLYAARRWARQHPAAVVYVRITLPERPALWFTFDAWRNVPNVAWRKLEPEAIADLPERLESVRSQIAT